MPTLNLANFGETISSLVDGNCPPDLECGPVDRWHEDIREEILSRISVTDVADADDAVDRLGDWRDSLDREDLLEGIWIEITYSADCEAFVSEYENECDEAVFSMYGDFQTFVMSVSPVSFTSLVDSLANAGADYMVRNLAYEWSSNLCSDIDDLIREIEDSVMWEDEKESDN